MSESNTQKGPILSLAVRPRNNGDWEKLQRAPSVLVQEDPSIRIKTASADGSTILSGMSELHLELICDPGFGFGVGRSVGVKTDGFGGPAVGHGSRENHVGKGYFLIGDEVAHWIFGHKWLRLPRSCEVAREKLRAEISELLEARREPIFRFLIML